MRIKKLMNSHITTLAMGASLAKIVRAMKKRETDAVILTDRWGTPLGIVTDHDISQSLDDHRLEITMDWYEKDVYRPPPRPLISLSPGHSIGVAVDIMDRMSIRHIPVVEEGRLVGMVTSRHVLAHCANLHRSGACAERSRNTSSERPERVAARAAAQPVEEMTRTSRRSERDHGARGASQESGPGGAPRARPRRKRTQAMRVRRPTIR